MATRSDFTDDEWAAMQNGVTGAGALVSVSDRDFTDTFGEASALAKALARTASRATAWSFANSRTLAEGVSG